MEPVFINEKVEITKGTDAVVLLELINDSCFFHEGRGVPEVSKERWMTAQTAELRHWMKIGWNTRDDRNLDHLIGFNHYETIKGTNIKNAIEVGCGPFTNLRIIGSHVKIKEVDLLDPLIEQYLAHSNCTYSRTRLFIEKSWLPFVNLIFLYNRKRIRHFFFKSLSIRRMFVKPFEEFNEKGYDMLIMINVLEHCYNFNAITKNVIACLNDGGLFVFHDKIYDESNVKTILTKMYDAAHPLKVGFHLVENFLSKHFIQGYFNITKKEIIVDGDTYFIKEFYYIGKKMK